jgi:hypothetical protein
MEILAMQVVFESRDPAAAGLQPLAERRMRFVMRRLGWLVPQARIRMADDNGPRGGVDKRCQVELRTNGLGPVVVTAVSRHWRDALDQALKRAAQTLLRQWRRTRQTPRMDARAMKVAA